MINLTTIDKKSLEYLPGYVIATKGGGSLSVMFQDSVVTITANEILRITTQKRKEKKKQRKEKVKEPRKNYKY